MLAAKLLMLWADVLPVSIWVVPEPLCLLVLLSGTAVSLAVTVFHSSQLLKESDKLDQLSGGQIYPEVSPSNGCTNVNALVQTFSSTEGSAMTRERVVIRR